MQTEEARTVTKEEIEKEICCLTEELVRINSDIIYEFPFKEYLAYLEEFIPSFSHRSTASRGNGTSPFKEVMPRAIVNRALNGLLELAGHWRISRRRRNWFSCIVSSYESAIICRYNKLVLAFLMRNALDLLPYKNFPREIVDLYCEWFTRVLNDFHERSDGYYSVKEPAFCHDVGVCCLRSIPVGGAWVVRKSGIGLRFLLILGPWQVIKYVSFVIRKTGGFSPFYEIHTVSRYLNLFGAEEMELAYTRIAELMKRDPGIRGVIREGWLLDPNLEKISPNLAFLRKVPQENGARLFPCVTTSNNIRGALSMSSIRRRLYNEGKYQPTAYSYIWPRGALIEWSKGRDGLSGIAKRIKNAGESLGADSWHSCDLL
jgi:hypothetical protein